MKKIDFKKVATKTAGLAGGGVASGLLVKQLGKIEAIPQPAILVPCILIAAGVFVPEFLSPGKKSSEIIGYVGDGMIASGANALVRHFAPNLISGIGDVENYIANPRTMSDLPAGMETIPNPAYYNADENPQAPAQEAEYFV